MDILTNTFVDTLRDYKAYDEGYKIIFNLHAAIYLFKNKDYKDELDDFKKKGSLLRVTVNVQTSEIIEIIEEKRQ